MARFLSLIFAFAIALALAAPTATAKDPLPPIKLTEVSTDATYGYTEKNPIKVGGVSPARERQFLDLLLGPNGEAIRYERDGSCCGFETPNGIMGGGLLDIYSVWIGSGAEPVQLYINMYDFEQPKAPKGFTIGAAMWRP
jgi:hypothetical protein